jgi:hypothetical protein
MRIGPEVSRRTRWHGPAMVLLLGLCAAAAADDAPAPSLALARTLQLSHTLLLGVDAAWRNGVKDGKVSAAQLDCVEHIDQDTFTPIYGKAIENVLSGDEITAANAFFSSSAGQTVIRMAFAQVRSGTAAAPVFSDQEAAEVRQFYATSAGRKLGVEKVLQSAQVMELLRPVVVPVLTRCKS